MNLNPVNYHYRLLLIRQLSSLNTKKSLNHYDALGITKNATIADIKSAYYKLSMVYHPDKNPDNKNDNNNNNSIEASQKFRDITEAYKVLSNIKTRKLYDRGLLMNNNTYSTTTATDDIDLKNKFYQSRERRSRAPTQTGRTVIYDFDEWTRTHYGATFVRDMHNKERRKKQENFKKNLSQDIKSERMLILIVTAFVFCTFIFHVPRDADIVRIKHD